MKHGVILLAGGSSRRMEGETEDKILFPLGGSPVVQYSITRFLESDWCGEIVIVHRDEEQKRKIAELLPQNPSAKIQFVTGGKERMHSVYNGLKGFKSVPDLVLIHDAARPFLSDELLDKLIEAAKQSGAACPAAKVTDTLKRASGDMPSTLSSVPRENLWAMQTPQVFEHTKILEAYKLAIEEEAALTDDTSAIERMGQKVTIVENPNPNPKLTTPADLPWMEFLQSQT